MLAWAEKNEVWPKAGAVVFAFFLFFVFLEGYARFFVPELQIHPLCAFEADPVLGYRLKPDLVTRFATSEFDTTVQISSQGFRDEVYGPKDGEFRVLGLGDSFAFGHGVEQTQTYWEVIEKDLENSAGKNARVLNAGTNGYGTTNDIRLLQQTVDSFSPDVVILTVFPGNDPTDNVAEAEGRIFDVSGTCLVSPATTIGEQVRRILFSDFYSLRFLSAVIKKSPLKTVAADFGLTGKEDPYSWTDIISKKPTPAIQRGLDYMQSDFAEFKILSEARQFVPVVVIVPFRFSVDQNMINQAIANNRISASDADPFALFNTIESLAKSEGLQVVNLQPVFWKAIGMDENVFFPIDGHWNVQGHQLAGREIFSQLKEKGVFT